MNDCDGRSPLNIKRAGIPKLGQQTLRGAVQRNGGALLAPPYLMGKEIRRLVFAAAASDTLVHQELDLGPAIFAPPRGTLIGSRRVALTHCAR